MALMTPEVERLIKQILADGNSVMISTSKQGLSVSEISRKKKAEIKILACPSGGK